MSKELINLGFTSEAEIEGFMKRVEAELIELEEGRR